MGIKMKRINEDIKNKNFSHVYLLYGPEDYLRRQYRDKLKEALLEDADEMNYNYYEGKSANPNAIIDMAETMPFFATRRVIVIENTGFFKSAVDGLPEYMDSLTGSTHFIFVEQEVDKRNRMFKAVKANGYVSEFKAQDELTLKKWVAGMVAKEGKKIEPAVLHQFLIRTGVDMDNIRKELEKLICYTLYRETITLEDIEAVCTKHIEGKIFDMIRALGEKKQKEALDLYYDLLNLKEPPMRILFLITRQFNMLLQVKELRKKGMDNRLIAEKMGLQQFVVGKYVTQASKFQKEVIRAAVEDCVNTEHDIKTGNISDSMGVEMLIIRYSTP